MRSEPNSPSQRSGFTLVEILVVLTIIIILAGIAVALTPTLTTSSRITGGASRVQTSLYTAKSMALRDQFPRGVRLVRESNTPFLDPPTNSRPDPNYSIVKTLQYLEQPAPYINGVLLSIDPVTTIASFQLADFTTGAVLPGDYLDVSDPNAKSLSLILSTPLTNSQLQPNQLQLASAPSTGLSYPRQYRIIRGPRPMIGEKQIDLPKDIFIDVSKSVLLADQSTGQLDIVVSPSGQVTRANQSLGKVVLWVRGVDGSTNIGEQYLVVLNTRTGLVGTYPVDITVGGDPYSFTKSGRGSGM